jgi:simple sugar transport system permease protein
VADQGSLVAVILETSVRAGTPLLLATLGEILAQRAGIVNLGLEGAMLMGAVAAAWVGITTDSLPLAVIAAIVAGSAIGLLHALSVVSAGVGMLASGICVFFVGKGLSVLWGAPIAGQPVPALPALPLPFLSDLPVIGSAMFRQDALVYGAALLACGLWWLLFRARMGLLIRATGEDAQVARAEGVPVAAIRIGTVAVGAGLAGLGGAHILLAFAHTWIEGLTAGRGWIAIGLVILARWNPLLSLPIACLFGGIMAAQLHAQAAGIAVSSYLLSMLPYLLTIAALVGSRFWMRGTSVPAELMRKEH